MSHRESDKLAQERNALELSCEMKDRRIAELEAQLRQRDATQVLANKALADVSDLRAMLLRLVEWVEGEGSIVPTKLVASARKLLGGGA